MRASTRPSHTAHSQRGTLSLREGKDCPGNSSSLPTVCWALGLACYVRSYNSPVGTGTQSPAFTQRLAHRRHSSNSLERCVCEAQRGKATHQGTAKYRSGGLNPGSGFLCSAHRWPPLSHAEHPEAGLCRLRAPQAPHERSPPFSAARVWQH